MNVNVSSLSSDDLRNSPACVRATRVTRRRRSLEQGPDRGRRLRHRSAGSPHWPVRRTRPGHRRRLDPSRTGARRLRPSRPGSEAATRARSCPNHARRRRRSRRNCCSGTPAHGNARRRRRSGPERPNDVRRCGCRRRDGRASCCCRSTSAAEPSPSNRTGERWPQSPPAAAAAGCEIRTVPVRYRPVTSAPGSRAGAARR
jgi:hypothetical protein